MTPHSPQPTAVPEMAAARPPAVWPYKRSRCSRKLSPAVEDTPTEQWFVAILVFESRIVEDPTDYEPKVDVQYRLVRAVDAESAYARALALGRREQHSYKNPDGETCEWVFAGLQDLRWVDDQELGHGAQVYGFIEDGVASECVVAKDQLTEFRGRSAAD